MKSQKVGARDSLSGIVGNVGLTTHTRETPVQWALSVFVSSVCAVGHLGFHVWMFRQGSVSSVVTPSSRLLVWATSFQEGSQAGSCVLFGTELGGQGCQEPKARPGSKEREEPTSYSPTLDQTRKEVLETRQR